MFSVLSGILTGGSAKLIGIAIVVASILGVSAYGGYRFQEGKVLRAKTALAQEVVVREKAQADYRQLQGDVAAAMEKVAARAKELDQEKVNAQRKAEVGFKTRMDAVLDAHKRLLDASTSRTDSRGAGVPPVRVARCERDETAGRVIADRLRECDSSEARLNTILDACENQPGLCEVR